MLRKAIFAAAAMAVIGTSAYAQESTEPITVGMSGGYFPFTFVRQGELQGFEVDLMNAIGEELGWEIEFETMSFSGLIGALAAGRIDTHRQILPLRRCTAFVFRNYLLFANRTARQNITEALITVRGQSPDEARGRADAILRETGLIDKAEFYPAALPADSSSVLVSDVRWRSTRT